MKGRLPLVSVVLLAACARSLPPPATRPELPPFLPVQGDGPLNVTLGPQGRVALLGEYKLAPEGMGFDVSKLMPNTASLVNGALWCVEPVSWLDDALVLNVGITWWPPGAEPNMPSASITQALMRCLGFFGKDAAPWSRATVYLRPGSNPQVIPMSRTPIMQEGTDTLVAAFEEAFLFGAAAPFMVRGFAWRGGTQDGAIVESARGIHRVQEGHVKHQGDRWDASTRITYSTAPDADRLKVAGASAATNVSGVSYVVGKGVDSLLVPLEISRAALRLKAGVARTTITMTSLVRAEYSPGLSCVLRTLSPPMPWFPTAPAPETTDGGVPSESNKGSPATPPHYPGVDLEAAQKCQLSEEDQSGPRRMFR